MVYGTLLVLSYNLTTQISARLDSTRQPSQTSRGAVMEPILNGAPGFILLAFVVALAGYLRQVSMNAQDRIEQIESNKHSDLWPKEAEHTLDRVNLLRKTRRKIELVARPLFFLIAVVSLRAMLYALSRIAPSDMVYQYVGRASTWWSAEWLRSIDLGITFFLLLLVLAMWVMHESGKFKEKRLMEKLLAWREASIKAKESLH
jgi:hypothetical protein